MKYLLTIILFMSINVFAKLDKPSDRWELGIDPLEESLKLRNAFEGSLDNDKLVLCSGVRGKALDCANWLLNNYSSISVAHIDSRVSYQTQIWLIRD